MEVKEIATEYQEVLDENEYSDEMLAIEYAKLGYYAETTR